MPSLASNGGSSLEFLSQQQFQPTSSFSRDPHSYSRSTTSSMQGSYGSDQRLARRGASSSDEESSSSPSSSPERLPTLPPPIPSTSSYPTRISSPKRSVSGMTVPTMRQEQRTEEEEEQNDEEKEEARESAFTPLPSGLARPKTKADREREKALGLNSGPGKKDSMAKKLMRKRADSLKWAKYATVGTFEIELDLSNDDLRRN
ncbi:uncharacterized protein JCM6883_001451 [Sporobolomyces salmoneus]|uniref:uncharacterized protein n=1 Tax=Sporobolomyces salmoneus TaxID=183962 RepID=UPI003170007A